MGIGATRRPCTLALEGLSGAGKSSVARALAASLAAERLPEAYERIGPRPSLEVEGPVELASLEERLLLEETRRYAIARRLRALGRLVVLDTAYFGPITYTAAWAGIAEELAPALDRILARARRWAALGRLGVPEIVVYLDPPPGIARARARRDPGAHPPVLADRHAEVGARERRAWLEGFRAAAPGRLFVLRSEGTVGGIVREIAAKVLPRLPEAAPSLEELGRVLEAFARPSAPPSRGSGNR